MNQHAAPVGGCEHYIHRTASRLREAGIINTLLYEVDGAISPDFLRAFDHSFPLVEPARQLNAIGGDLVYLHRVDNPELFGVLQELTLPVFRFYHDHQLFCLREHKYTAIGSQTCTRPTGLGCYACLGFLQHSDRWPHVGLRSLGALHARQAANRHWDGHLVASEYMADHLAEHGFHRQRTHVVPLFVEHSGDDAPEQKQCSCDSGSPRVQGKGVVGFAGQLVRGKGVDVLLEAMTRLPRQTHLRIAGSGRQQSELQLQSERLGIADRVQFVGKLNSDALPAFLRSCDVVAMPSRAPETFGLAGLEASGLGIPVVATDVGGVRQWLRHEHNGLLCLPNRADALASALARLLESDALRRRLGENAAVVCREQFTAERHVLQLLRLFRTCLRGERL
ncbi:MAG: glycosyltransferase family 4 protein [Planctomycetales bacterium]|nr:glycosyltransferase family 4 protein [Planctomycetales bacterium]